MTQPGRLLARRWAIAMLAAACLPAVEARITRLDITSVEPAFEGRAFGRVGTYEKLRGKAYGELDPRDPHNAAIVDLPLAPRNSRGKVEYAMDVHLLKPADLVKGNRKLFFEVKNRGAKLFGPFNGSRGGNDPKTADDAGDAFLMSQGYAIAWSGWDPSAPGGGDNLTITLPVAQNADGSAISGPSYEYLVFDDSNTLTATLAYPPVNTETSKARLTVRDHLTDAPLPLPPSAWEFVGERGIRLLPAGTPFKQSAIYELGYTARNPFVGGIGFAATRDLVAFLRHAKADDIGIANPMAGNVRRVHAFGVSQPGRYLNDFVSLGFNQDESDTQVFDGVLNWVAGGTGVGLNLRFAQPARTERNRQHHLSPEALFPFSYTTLDDPLGGRRDGRSLRCLRSNTCPKIMAVNSSNEYWVKAASLLHIDSQGRDLPDPPNVRYYLISGTEHGAAGSPPDSPGLCQQPRNTTDPTPALRALFVALDQWTDGVRPPPSEVPRVADGTAIAVRATADTRLGIGEVAPRVLGWPAIPNVRYTGVATVRQQLDYGSRVESGVLDTNPPTPTGKSYPSFVSRVDVDGNEVAGIRLPPVAAPIATTTGWALRSEAFGGPDGCESAGQLIPFANTRPERVAAGDGRFSIEERYRDHDDYVSAVARAAQRLAERRLLLPADVARYINAARASDVLRRAD